MTTVGFKYCALYYMNQWLTHDKGVCEALAGHDTNEKFRQIGEAAKFYAVARNLPTRYDKDKGLKRYEPVINILETLNPSEFQGDNLLPSIKKVEDQISAEYGNRGTLSLTTKFLWLKLKSPIIIYDSQARKALDEPKSIEQYYSQWRKRFSDDKRAIQDACASLVNVHEYVSPRITTPQDVTQIASEPWFRERVFDVYLWHLGE